MREEVEVCVKLPKDLVEFVKLYGSPEEYFRHLILEGFRADWEDLLTAPLTGPAILKSFKIKSILTGRYK